MSDKRECPNSKTEIVDSRDKHWDTNLVCAKCCAKANNCGICRESWQRWENRK